jgi:hypothetical protein
VCALLKYLKYFDQKIAYFDSCASVTEMSEIFMHLGLARSVLHKRILRVTFFYP